MRSDPITCAAVAERFAAVAGGEIELDDAVIDHVESCLRCQAERAQYRRLMKAIDDLRDAPAPFDLTLQHEILFAIDNRERLGRGIVTSRVAAAIGGLAAGAAAAAGVIALTVRQRRVARLAS